LGTKRRKESEDLIRRIMHRVVIEIGIEVLVYPPLTSYVERSILDQVSVLYL